MHAEEKSRVALGGTLDFDLWRGECVLCGALSSVMYCLVYNVCHTARCTVSSMVYSVAQCVVCVAVCDIWCDVLCGVYAFRMPGVQCSVWCTLLYSMWFVL